MDIKKIIELTDAKCVCGTAKLSDEIVHGFASDLMSDVLTLDTEGLLLITGLCNLQTIRTAEMSDISYILFARDKHVTQEMTELAQENNMVLLQTHYSMFRVSGILYNEGLTPLF